MCRLIQTSTIVIILTFCVATIAQGDSFKKSWYFSYKGYQAEKRGDLKTALTYYTKAIKLSYANFGAYINRGLIYIKKKQYDLAIKDFNWVIDFYPDHATALFYRSVAYYELRKYNKAINDIRRVIAEIKAHPKIYPTGKMTDALLGLATCYHRLGKYQQAITYFSKALKRRPKDEDIFYYRGVAYADSRLYQRALADFTNAIRLKPGFAEAYLERSRVFFALNLYKKSLRDLNRAIALRPDFTKQYILRGMVHLMAGNVISAGEDFLNYFLFQFK